MKTFQNVLDFQVQGDDNLMMRSVEYKELIIEKASPNT